MNCIDEKILALEAVKVEKIYQSRKTTHNCANQYPTS